jgi:transcriptional regulator with XRE-family HTH domain
MSKPKLPIAENFQIGLYDADMAGRPPTKEAPLFGKRLAQARKAQGLSQEELAAKLGTSRVNLAYYERKAENPTLEFLNRCADVLQMPVSELIGEDHADEHKKPGPKSKLEKQLEAVRKLPRAKQKFVSEFLETVLQAS